MNIRFEPSLTEPHYCVHCGRSATQHELATGKCPSTEFHAGAYTEKLPEKLRVKLSKVQPPEPPPSALDTQVGGSHYKNFAIQPAEFISANKIGFLEGCVIKRVCRWRDKDGLKDLQKAIHELQLLIELELKYATPPKSPSA